MEVPIKRDGSARGGEARNECPLNNERSLPKYVERNGNRGLLSKNGCFGFYIKLTLVLSLIGH